MDNLFQDVADTTSMVDTNIQSTDVSAVNNTEATDTPELWSEGHPSEQALVQPNAKLDPKRAEYWQSQADKAKAALTQREAEFKAREAKYAELEQLDAYLRQNPSVVQQLQGVLKADSPKADAGLQKPTRPEAPEGYNEVEAYQDPTSASWKHRKAMEKYRDDLDVYYDKRESLKEQEENARMEAMQQQAQYQQAMQQTYTMLQAQHGMSPQEAQDFVQTFSDDSSITIDNLVKLYRVLKQPASRPVADPRITRQVNNARIPQPLSRVNGYQQQDISDEDIFNLGLLQAGKRR